MATTEDGVTTAPPSYETVFTFADSTQYRRPSVFSLLRTMHRRKAVLSRIRDVVSAPNFIPSSVAQIVGDCATALSPPVFSHLLQMPNIQGHTALYWAIVNDRREAFLSFIVYITRFSRAGYCDLRLACMVTNDQELFQLLNLGANHSIKDEPLICSSGCPQDDVQVDEGDRSCHFIAYIRIRLFQKRLRTTQSLNVEFVARGRIWRVHIYLKQSSRAPARPCCEIFIKPQEEEPQAGYSTQCIDTQSWGSRLVCSGSLLPSADKAWDNSNPKLDSPTCELCAKSCDLAMDDNTGCGNVDCDGTFHAAVIMSQKRH
ncbi:hypothetical protein BDR07DRAFT_1609724 [Suillus spraguei]|nr:hypothetical protein BDR07DRAFT_1609724 [Suillus spraguei]